MITLLVAVGIHHFIQSAMFGFVKELRYTWLGAYDGKKSTLDENATLADFTVKDLQGNDVSLSKYIGKVVLVVNSASK